MPLNGADVGVNRAQALRLTEEYCRLLSGKRPISKILVANNGISAVKFIRSIRSWSYEAFGTEKTILLVGMATPDDMKASLEHIRMVDQFVEVPGGTNNNNYANAQLIVEVAERTSVDAVWPGWGHASENPELPSALLKKGIAFLGPPASAMATLGDKIGSSIIAQAARVPTLPWSGSHVRIAAESCQDPIPESVYRQACVFSAEEAAARCRLVGYPAMIKASWGGGGKGIRRVQSEEEVLSVFPQVQGEVPGSPIFVMALASHCRHLEVQLVADEYGQVAALHSRDCSIQRRHQKIIEEGPVTIASPATVRELEEGACRLALSVGYVGAATVEYLYSMDSGHFYFLELNPRLQVEHPVTEWIAGVNLPAIQLNIAMGIPLCKIPELRRLFGQQPHGNWSSWRQMAAANDFSFQAVSSVKPKGHVVAVRITSEDPDDGFKPTAGRVQELSFRSKPDVWAYFSIKSGGAIHEYSDSQFGHLFAFGESRKSAIANMVLTLKELHIRGEIRTNVNYTVDLLQSAEYQENQFHTGWLDTRIARRMRTERIPWHISVVAGALQLATRLVASRVSEYLDFLEKGQIPPINISLVYFEVSLNLEGVKYIVAVARPSPNGFILGLNSSKAVVEVHSLRDGGLLIQMDGNSHVVFAEEEANGTRLMIGGRTCLLQNDHDPSRLIAETPCKLVRYIVPPGSPVTADCAYAEVEVMKMCMPLLTPASGTIHFHMAEGQALQAGDLIATLDLDDPSAIFKSLPFEGQFPAMVGPTIASNRVHQQFSVAESNAWMLLAGYQHTPQKVVSDLVSCLTDQQLPFLQWQECMSVLATRIPSDLKKKLEDVLPELQTEAEAAATAAFPASQLLGVFQEFLSCLPADQAKIHASLVDPLVQLATSYSSGLEGKAELVVKQVLDEFVRVEELFVGDLHEAEVIESLRIKHKNDLSRVVHIVLSHQALENKTKFVLLLMETFVVPSPGNYEFQLSKLLSLGTSVDAELSRLARALSERIKSDSIQSEIVAVLRASGDSAAWHSLVVRPGPIEDALVGLLVGQVADLALRMRVARVHVERLYQLLLVAGSLEVSSWSGHAHSCECLVATWQFVNFPNDEGVSGEGATRFGALVVCDAGLEEALPAVASLLEGKVNSKQGNILHLLCRKKEWQSPLLSDRTISQHFETLSLVFLEEGCSFPTRLCFQWSHQSHAFQPSKVPSSVEPPLLANLQLERLSDMQSVHYQPSRDGQWHLYSCQEPPNAKGPISRLFVRGCLHPESPPEGDQVTQFLKQALRGALDVARAEMAGGSHHPDHIHVLVVMLGVGASALQGESDWCAISQRLESSAFEVDMSLADDRERMGLLAWEATLRVRSSCSPSVSEWHVSVDNPSGYSPSIQVLQVSPRKPGEPASFIRHVTSAVFERSTLEPYRKLSAVDRKRLLARRNKTTYCYDLPLLLGAALRSMSPALSASHASPVEFRELVMREGQSSITEVERAVGANSIGMVAWRVTLHTEQYPAGRPVLLLANDVTFRAGSFGPAEDRLFQRVTDLACAEGCPLLYVAANSGARIGLAAEVQQAFKVAWGPQGQVEYLYLEAGDYERLKGSVVAERVEGARWRLCGVVGREDGLGVESLSGSGAIAGAFARAYRETVTITFVSGRTVGVGAYLARLGVRCIQRLDQSIILTGFSALNKLLGRSVYTSHMQLGGPKIMAANGVTHLTVPNDLEGARALLRWLSYVPAVRGDPIPVSVGAAGDPPSRGVQYEPELFCDPHCAFSGCEGPGGEWAGGIFDRGSFQETLSGWGAPVVVGRARLGGMPVGVVGVRTVSQTVVVPADPGQADSVERQLAVPGQVWGPDSAEKTAGALKDFDREGLPLFVLANWRGFSGGQRDLFDGVLQAGSKIVDNLAQYRQPVTVFIPKCGELRGGAWVVLDSQINPGRVEMYAETTARGSVLEPEGTVEIKFRDRDVRDCILRLEGGAVPEADLSELIPRYRNAALKFAELHDGSVRMKAKGVIRAVVDWKDSRRFFCHRIAARVAADDLLDAVRNVAKVHTREEAAAVLSAELAGLGDAAEWGLAWSLSAGSRVAALGSLMLQTLDVADAAEETRKAHAASAHLTRCLENLRSKADDGLNNVEATLRKWLAKASTENQAKLMEWMQAAASDKMTTPLD